MTVQFTRLHLAYPGNYSRVETPAAIAVGLVEDPSVRNGVFWEFCINWVNLGSKLCMKIEIFGDSVAALAVMAPFFAELATYQGKAVTEPQIVILLKKHGCVDVTTEAAPARPPRCPMCRQPMK